ADFRAIARAEDMPVILRGAPFVDRQFSFSSLEAEIGDLALPERSSRDFFVGDQSEGKDVMENEKEGWNPQQMLFREFATCLRANSSHYLSTRSANRACKREAEELVYDDSRCSDGSDALLKALIAKSPFPKLLPEEEDLVIVFWLGSKGKNFGLHT
ncbi:unnamed protein product, partial [Polarella glacialis]